MKKVSSVEKKQTTIDKDFYMKIYKELSFVGNKTALDNFKKIAPSLVNGEWRYCTSDRMADFISFDYIGSEVDQAEVCIYYGSNILKDGKIKIVNIIPLRKNQLTIEEYNAVLDLFYEDVIKPNKNKLAGLTIVGPESDEFDPLKYISKEALEKLERFCFGANKSTGSSHPCDEDRWFDFICQTVDDDQVFDYDILYRFLKDEDYWGKKEPGFLGAMGNFAWDEEHAGQLASEYDNYVRILKYYKKRMWIKAYEAEQE